MQRGLFQVLEAPEAPGATVAPADRVTAQLVALAPQPQPVALAGLLPLVV
jgi:hypothetical protein